MPFAAFDLEVAREIPEGVDWKSAAPLGITCAAFALGDEAEPRFFQGAPQMSRAACAELVKELQRVAQSGYTLVTWNGTAFDFAILAQESALYTECAELALAHVDAMVIVTFRKGYFLSLKKALTGAGISGKLQTVRLKDGSQLFEMSGNHAPQLWARGEYDAVLGYLREDVVPLLRLAESVQKTKMIRWTSSKGLPQSVTVTKMWSVRECFAFPLPDTSWMTIDPPQRSKFIEWMPPLADVIPSSVGAPRDLRELPLFSYAAADAYW